MRQVRKKFFTVNEGLAKQIIRQCRICQFYKTDRILNKAQFKNFSKAEYTFSDISIDISSMPSKNRRQVIEQIDQFTGKIFTETTGKTL
jgi:hypothetical protein